VFFSRGIGDNTDVGTMIGYVDSRIVKLKCL